jgi:hypothetical protein
MSVDFVFNEKKLILIFNDMIWWKNIVCHKILESINFRFEKKKEMHFDVKYLRKFIMDLKTKN